MKVGWNSTQKSFLTNMKKTCGMQGDMYQHLKSSLNDVELWNNLDKQENLMILVNFKPSLEIIQIISLFSFNIRS